MATVPSRFSPGAGLAPILAPAGCLSAGAGLVLSRLLYEHFFPTLQMFGGWGGSLLLTGLITLAGLALAAWLVHRQAAGRALIPFLPLILPLPYLFDNRILPLGAAWLFGLSLGLLTLLTLGLAAPHRRWPFLLVLAGSAIPYLLTMGRTVGRADTFEFQVRTLDLGIVHPTGYPLWLLLAKPFSWLPFGSPAWRVNLAAVAWGVLTTGLLYGLLVTLTGRRWPAALAALVWATRPTFWSQAIEAEVYSLHAVIVAGALWQMIWLLGQPQLETGVVRRGLIPLATWLGLGLTNHLTTLFLLPPAGYLFLRQWLLTPDKGAALRWLLPRLTATFLLPLALYAYLPLRWQATNGEPMGFRRFLDWVVGGRFQGALQWRAWLDDPARWQIVGRLFLAEWGWWGLSLALLGLLLLLWRRRDAAVLLLLTGAGFTFYCLNYLVPDLAVFLLPAQLVVAVGLGAALGLVAELLPYRWLTDGRKVAVGGALLLAGLAPFALAAPATWQVVDRSAADNFTAWGRQVLSLPLADGATILADSEKIAPLLYLQEAEGYRPDLNIMVLPDEAAYLNELHSRVGQGQTVYLARFLPRLEGIYHLRSLGPLTEVSPAPLTALPDDASRLDQVVGPLRLLGWREAMRLPGDALGLTLFWSTDKPTSENLLIYARWTTDGYSSPPEPLTGQHPANNFYPTLAWDQGEIVPDYQQLSWPLGVTGAEIRFQVAVAPPFAPASGLAWADVVAFSDTDLALADGAAQAGAPLRVRLSDGALTSIRLPAMVRPGLAMGLLLGCQSVTTLRLSWQTATGEMVGESLKTACDPAGGLQRLVLAAPADKGVYELWGWREEARCGWLRPASDGCRLGMVTVAGAAVPAGTTNFSDEIVLLSLEVPETRLTPGGLLAIDVVWQALADLTADYTVFVQILDTNDEIVGQLDSWPLQGTFPTSQWMPGEHVEDRYLVPVATDLTEGEYRLIIGWYLLGTPIQRLSVLDPAGAPIADKVELGGLVHP